MALRCWRQPSGPGKAGSKLTEIGHLRLFWRINLKWAICSGGVAAQQAAEHISCQRCRRRPASTACSIRPATGLKLALDRAPRAGGLAAASSCVGGPTTW